MTSEGIVQSFLESTFTGAEIMGFVATYTVGVAYLLVNLILAMGLLQHLFKSMKKKKNTQETKDTDK